MQTHSLAACLGAWIAQQAVSTRPLLVGLSGPQGSGKSTAAQALSASDAAIVVLSLDDFYLTRAQRKQLADTVSPLLATRGPPGTHDTQCIHSVLDALQQGLPVEVPVFSKVNDDRRSEGAWLQPPATPAIILLEGWMVGATAGDKFVTDPPLNDLESGDEDHAWRHYQSQQLSGPYQDLWDRFDAFIHVEAPDFQTVTRWRLQQEASNLDVPMDELPAERQRWVEQFVQYYQRLTLAMQAGARRQGAVIRLDKNRRVLEQSLFDPA